MRPALAPCFVVVVALGCAPPGEAPRIPEAPCDADSAARSSLERFDEVRVFLDDDDEAAAPLLREELARYLGRMWGGDVTVERGAPPDDDTPALWLSTRAGVDVPEGGYVLRRTGARMLVAANDPLALAHGAFALLEQLGARFFHPKDELVPALQGAYLPRELDEERAPAFLLRGLHLHLLHPLEYMRPFLVPGGDNLDDAKLVVDWLVKTGQNHLQWYMMRTVPWDGWVPHAEAILEHAHARGLSVGMVVQVVDDGSSLQNQFVLTDDEGDMFAQVDASVDRVLALPFDHLEMALGEFFAGDPVVLVALLDHITAYVSERYPGVTVGIENHVGNYPELYLEYQGETRYYYHLPGLADERLINNVHTVFFFDLYRDWAMYEHESFALQREFIFEQLPVRPVRYFPESAYWVSADIDVPVFLAEYLHARWLDIHNLARDIEERGLPPLDGHVLYSSGHEWSYWMIDYLTARMLWDAEAPLDDHLAHVAAPFGACAAELSAALAGFTATQTELLFDERLVPYVSADDLHDDLGYAAGIDTHPPRVPFEALLAMSDGERAAFERDVIVQLERAGAEVKRELNAVSAVCARADELLMPWCDELQDSIAVVELKLAHSAHLYRAVLDGIARRDPDVELGRARAVREDAAAVIARRATRYRYDLEELTASYENFTRYEFGYLRQAHTQCLWLRQEAQVEFLLENGEAASPFVLPTCQE